MQRVSSSSSSTKTVKRIKSKIPRKNILHLKSSSFLRTSIILLREKSIANTFIQSRRYRYFITESLHRATLSEKKEKG